MKSILTIILFLIVLTGCKRHTKFELILTDTSENRYWVRKEMDSLGKYQDLFDRFQFNLNRSCNVYHSTLSDQKGSRLYLTDGEYNNTWNYNEKDSVLIVGGLVYKIVNYSKDSILMEGHGYKGKFAFIKSK